MKTLKNILLTIGILSLLLFVILLVIGIKVVSVIFLYILGAVAIVSLVIYAIFRLGKFAGKSESKE